MNQRRILAVVAVLALLASLGMGVGGATSALDELGLEGPADTAASAALSTSFTYQGQLRDEGGTVNDTCDLQFTLWDAAAGGAQVGSTILLEDVLLEWGLFTARLDFGAAAFQGQARYLEVAASCPVGSAFVPLPRQELTASPYALYALSAWSLTGNSGTTPGTNYLGTSDNQALELKVNGARALRLEPASSPNLLGGYSGNQVTAGVSGATISGGGSSGWAQRVTDHYGTVSGGANNRAGDNAGTVSDASYATVGGGLGNTAQRESATIGGGAYNNVLGAYGTVAGGDHNHAYASNSTVAGGGWNEVTGGGSYAFIGGGYENSATQPYAAVAGGYQNSATGSYATIAGGGYNTASGDGSTIAGGGGYIDLGLGGWPEVYTNTVTSILGTIGGGGLNRVAGDFAAVAGGWENIASGEHATVGGGRGNTASGRGATISGGGSGTYNPSTASGAYSTIGGGSWNTASGDEATIAGGYHHRATGLFSTVGGGSYNEASEQAATVGGGIGNTASGPSSVVAGGGSNTASAIHSTVGGGLSNTASGERATVGGGYSNMAGAYSTTVSGGSSNTANADYATVGGGYNHLAIGANSTVGGGTGNGALVTDSTVGGGNGNVVQASGSGGTIGGGWHNFVNGNTATVPGGAENEATGGYSFAAGAQAHATHAGAFVWSSATATDSWGANTFTVRSHGGARFYSAAGTATGVQLSAGGTSFASISDRNAKEAFAPVDTARLLEVLAGMPVQTWNLKSQASEMRHIGPVAQDFNGNFAYLFGEVESPIHINNMDAVGVSLAASQGLYQLSQEQAMEIAALQAENRALQDQVNDLEARLAALEAGRGMGESPARLPYGWLLLGGGVVAVGTVAGRRARGGQR